MTIKTTIAKKMTELAEALSSQESVVPDQPTGMPGVITLSVTSAFELELNGKQKRMIWDSFLQGGGMHSSRASTLPYLIRRCERENVPFVLVAIPGMGYTMRPIKGDQNET